MRENTQIWSKTGIFTQASTATGIRRRGGFEYTSFGSAVKERTASFTISYKFSMNTQEKEPELGEGVTSAEFWVYDGKLGRRWNMDPESRAQASPFSVLSNNPITRIDVLGNTDYYNKQGVWIGTDGNNDDLHIVITESKIARRINRKYTSKGRFYCGDELNDKNSYKLPKRSVLEASLFVFKKTSETTNTDIFGGRHEVMAILENPESEPQISESTKIFDSPTSTLESGYFNENSKDFPEGIMIHSHPFNLVYGNKFTLPDGTVYYDNIYNSYVEPSENDFGQFKYFDLNIIVGMGYGELRKYEIEKSLTSTGEVPTLKQVELGNYTKYKYNTFTDDRVPVIGFYSRAGTEHLRFDISSLMKILESCETKSDNYIKKNKFITKNKKRND